MGGEREERTVLPCFCPSIAGTNRSPTALAGHLASCCLSCVGRGCPSLTAVPRADRGCRACCAFLKPGQRGLDPWWRWAGRDIARDSGRPLFAALPSEAFLGQAGLWSAAWALDPRLFHVCEECVCFLFHFCLSLFENSFCLHKVRRQK